MDIILSSRNTSKIAQIQPIFSGLPVRILSLSEAGIKGEAVEDGETLADNALRKALFAWGQTKQWSMADDTGLFIDVLDGQPGIHAARWAGEGKSTEDIMRFTLEQLKGVPRDRRLAAFRTVAALATPEGDTYFFEGEVRGILLESPRVPLQPKMPYSGLFQPEGETKVWAEMSVEEENAISHRGKAFRKVYDFLKRRL